MIFSFMEEFGVPFRAIPPTEGLMDVSGATAGTKAEPMERCGSPAWTHGLLLPSNSGEQPLPQKYHPGIRKVGKASSMLGSRY